MPVSIPPFNNVPAPGDPITSPWAQQISQFVVDAPRIRAMYATGNAAVNGVGAPYTLIPPLDFTFTPIVGHVYRHLLVVPFIKRTAAGDVSVAIYNATAGGVSSNTAATYQLNENGTLVVQRIETGLPATPIQYQGRISSAVGTVDVWGGAPTRSTYIIEDWGKP